jgi:hypothetical protein
VNAVEKEMLQQPRDSVLLLVDTSGTIITPEALNIFKNVALHSKPFLHKTAVLGITGARRTFVEIVVKFSGLQVMTYDILQEAKDWLVSM